MFQCVEHDSFLGINQMNQNNPVNNIKKTTELVTKEVRDMREIIPGWKTAQTPYFYAVSDNIWTMNPTGTTPVKQVVDTVHGAVWTTDQTQPEAT